MSNGTSAQVATQKHHPGQPPRQQQQQQHHQQLLQAQSSPVVTGKEQDGTPNTIVGGPISEVTSARPYVPKIPPTDEKHFGRICQVTITPSHLRNAVEHFGGIEEVLIKRRWQRVREYMNVPKTKSSGNQYKKIYTRYFGLPPHLLTKNKGGHLISNTPDAQKTKQSTSTKAVQSNAMKQLKKSTSKMNKISNKSGNRKKKSKKRT